MEIYEFDKSRMKDIFWIFAETVDGIKSVLKGSEIPPDVAFNIADKLGQCRARLYDELEKEAQKSAEIKRASQKERLEAPVPMSVIESIIADIKNEEAEDTIYDDDGRLIDSTICKSRAIEIVNNNVLAVKK